MLARRLPAGLTLSTSTGVISGTPTAVTATASYTVTASNSARQHHGVSDHHGEYRGPGGPVLHSGHGGLHRGTPITANSPTSTGGPVASYSVSPALPAGLTLSATTGIISGTPTAVAATANYTVTASNSAGSTTATLTITVNAAPLSAEQYQPDLRGQPGFGVSGPSFRGRQSKHGKPDQ